MAERIGEKIGWIGGWLGSFAWVAILSAIFLFQAKWVEGMSGLLLFGAAVSSFAMLAPWRHPSTRYWKLMLAPFAILFGSVFWAVLALGGIEASGLKWWNVFWLLPMLGPFGLLGWRTWAGSDVH